MRYIKLYEQVNRTVKELDQLYDYFHLSWDRYNIYDPIDLGKLIPKFDQ